MRATIVLEDNAGSGIDVHVTYEPEGMSVDRSLAHKAAAGIAAQVGRFAKQIESIQRGASVEGARISDVSSAAVRETIGRDDVGDLASVMGGKPG